MIIIPEMGGDVANIAAMIGTDLTKESMKMTNEAIKQLLIFLIQKAKENGDKVGETSLRNLVRSNEEIKIFDLEMNQLNSFTKQAKDYQITYAVVEERNRFSVFYKASEEMRIKRILDNLVDKELNHTDKEIADNENPTERDKLEDKLDEIKDERPFEKNDEAPGELNKSIEVVEQKEDMMLYMKRNGIYERIPDQISDELRTVLRRMKDREQQSFDVGNGPVRLYVQRVGNSYVFHLDKDMVLSDRNPTVMNLRTLEEKRMEILPLLAVQRERLASGKNKVYERGGR